MMLLGIDWFVVEDSRRKAAINVLFLCEMVVSLYVVGFCFMYNIHDVHLPISIITHKHVFVPRHVVLFLGLMYYFFIGLLKHEVLKMHTRMYYLF